MLYPTDMCARLAERCAQQCMYKQHNHKIGPFSDVCNIVYAAATYRSLSSIDRANEINPDYGSPHSTLHQPRPTSLPICSVCCEHVSCMCSFYSFRCCRSLLCKFPHVACHQPVTCAHMSSACVLYVFFECM